MPALLAVLLQGSYPTGAQTSGSPPTAAGAPTRGNAPSPTTAKASKVGYDPMRVICKYDTPVGTRLPGPKICHTAQQWDDERSEARTRTEQSQAAKDIGRDPGN